MTHEGIVPDVARRLAALDVNEETTVGYSATYPAGKFEPEAVVSYAVRGLYYEFGRFRITVTAASQDVLARTAADSMVAFAQTLPTQGGDRQRVEDAAVKVERIEGAVYLTEDELASAIRDVLDAIEAVTRTGDPAGEPIRRQLEELLAVLEKR